MSVHQDRRWWLPLVLAVVISSAGVYQWYLQHPHKTPLSGDYVDTIVEGLQVLRYNEQGRLSQDLRSPHAEHYAQSKKTHFQRPIMLVYPTEASKSIWKISAGSGWLSGQKDRIDLSEAVDMHETSAHGKQLLTPEMTWYMDKKLAVTAAALVATEPGVRVTAVGATFDQSADLIRLLSRVTIRYQPKESV